MKLGERQVRLAGVIAPAIALAVFLVAHASESQTITVRLLNGKTGKPIANENVTVHWTGEIGPGLVVNVDSEGLGRFTVPAGKGSFTLTEGPRKGAEPDRVAYLDCNTPGMQSVSVPQVTAKGFVSGDSCGKAAHATRPGEVIFWGKPLPWWMPDMQ